ncbi:MAG: sensor histidine kinase [Flavobacteriaceae bacterium]
MIAPTDHPNEGARLESLKSYSILDTLPEEDYDNLTAIAAEICGTPISLVSLLDDKRQWFKSHHGLTAEETPKEYAFCAHAINEGDDIFIVQDARTDPRFKENPLVLREPLVIFYAGVPLKGIDGLPLGTLCVIDHKPKLLSKGQVASLTALANQVMRLLELRKNNNRLKQTKEELEEKNRDLEQFAYIAAHDLKSPLANISGMAGLLQDCYSENLDTDGTTMLDNIICSSEKLKGFIDGLLDYSKSDQVLREKKSWIKLIDLQKALLGLFAHDHSIEFTLDTNLEQIELNRAALEQILINLMANAIKYNDKDLVTIQLHIDEDADYYKFSLQDNGPGISEKHIGKIFEIFNTAASEDKFGKPGNGIGLATVKKLVEKMNGEVTAETISNKGARINFTLKK